MCRIYYVITKQYWYLFVWYHCHVIYQAYINVVSSQEWFNTIKWFHGYKVHSCKIFPQEFLECLFLCGGCGCVGMCSVGGWISNEFQFTHTCTQIYIYMYNYSGSTHSGHYTAYIRDVDNLGNWTHPVFHFICNYLFNIYNSNKICIITKASS